MEAAAVAAMRGGKVRFVALDRQHAPLERDLKAAFTRMLGSSAFTLGAEVERFEADFAEYSQTRHCIGVASGTAALSLMLGAYGIGAGDEVIVPAHTFIASALAVSHVGATPVLVDVLDGTGLMDPDAARAAVGPARRRSWPSISTDRHATSTRSMRSPGSTACSSSRTRRRRTARPIGAGAPARSAMPRPSRSTPARTWVRSGTAGRSAPTTTYWRLDCVGYGTSDNEPRASTSSSATTTGWMACRRPCCA